MIITQGIVMGILTISPLSRLVYAAGSSFIIKTFLPRNAYSYAVVSALHMLRSYTGHNKLRKFHISLGNAMETTRRCE